MQNTTLSYPIGRFQIKETYSSSELTGFISHLSQFPSLLDKAVSGLHAESLSKTYRPGGWNIQQVVHHLADSHMNSYMRFKLALTEENPTIKPYLEESWAVLPDSLTFPVEASLEILSGIHKRWVFLLESLTEDEWSRTFYHAESQRTWRLDQTTGLYAWHGQHHLAHVHLALGE